ncbi:tetratricopeptide repeat protein [Actinomadura harenae]|nr:tetratricopeptide repeat protein [Actinomadura harenae]
MSRLGCLLADAGQKEPARRWYQAAAERGHTIAMINLAILLEDDDRDAAMAWTLRAAEEGTGLTAQHNYGIFLEEDGRLDEALDLYRQAAERGDREAAEEAARLSR